MKVYSVRKEQILAVLYVVIIAAGVITTFRTDAVTTFFMPAAKKIILIDAGHGGKDPGMVGGETLEKDLNLEIAQKLQAYLEQGGSVVLLTRADDGALGSKKGSDMRERKEISLASKADLLISIHQNSYPQEEIKGAQVFYYNESDSSKRLAECIQSEIKKFADPENHRSAKANTNYYILKQTKMPAVIVECGFLSNSAERKNLESEEYQEKMAWSIYKGILNYFDGQPGEKVLQ